MPNDLSNAFHADLDLIKAAAEKLLARGEKFIEDVLARAPGAIEQFIVAVEPYVIAIAEAAFEAALASETGGIGAVAKAAEVAAVAGVTADKSEISDAALLAIKAAILNKTAQATAAPAAG